MNASSGTMKKVKTFYGFIWKKPKEVYFENENGIQGERLHWYSNGNLFEKSEWLNGKLHGVLEYYHEDGILVLRQKWNNGVLENARTYHKNGKLASLAFYDIGHRLHGEFTTYDSEGNIDSVSTYNHNTPHGSFKRYYPNGQVKEETTFVNGYKQGPCISYHSDGTVKDTGNYFNDVYISDHCDNFSEYALYLKLKEKYEGK